MTTSIKAQEKILQLRLRIERLARKRNELPDQFSSEWGYKENRKQKNKLWRQEEKLDNKIRQMKSTGFAPRELTLIKKRLGEGKMLKKIEFYRGGYRAIEVLTEPKLNFMGIVNYEVERKYPKNKVLFEKIKRISHKSYTRLLLQPIKVKKGKDPNYSRNYDIKPLNKIIPPIEPNWGALF